MHVSFYQPVAGLVAAFPFYLQFRFYLGKNSSSVPILGETGNGGLIHMRSYADHRQAIKAKPG